MPIDPVLLGLVIGAVFGTITGFAAAVTCGLPPLCRAGTGARRPWPVTEPVARDLATARRVLDSLAKHLNEAYYASPNTDARDVPVRAYQVILSSADVNESALLALTTTLQTLEAQAVPGPASDSEAVI